MIIIYSRTTDYLGSDQRPWSMNLIRSIKSHLYVLHFKLYSSHHSDTAIPSSACRLILCKMNLLAHVGERMSMKECHRLVVSLADSLEDLKIQIDDNDGTWTVEIVKIVLEKDNKTKDLIELAQSLLRLLDIDASERNGVESLDSWSQLLSTFPSDVPLKSLLQENGEKRSAESVVTDKSKLEYLHVLATTLQQRRLKQLKEGKEIQHTDNPDYPLNFLSGQASAEQKSLLLEGYAYLKEDYEQRRQGMRQRFKVILETEGSGKKDFETVSPHPPRQLNPMDDLSWLVQHFISPHSTHVGASGLIATRNPSAPKQSGNNLPSTETSVDRGGRVDNDESRYAMPEWQSAGGQELKYSQPQHHSSNLKKNTGQKEKQGPGTPGRQSNDKDDGGQQSNEQKDEGAAPESDNEKTGDKDDHKKNNRRGGGNTGRKEKQGPGTPGRQSNGKDNERQQFNEQKDEGAAPEGDNEKAGDKDDHRKNNRRGGGNTGRKEKQGPGIPGRQSNGKDNERQQFNEQKDEGAAPEGDNEKAGDKDDHRKNNRRGGGNTGRKERQGPGTSGSQSNGKDNARQQSNEQKDEGAAPEGDNEKAGEKEDHKKNNRRSGGNRRRGRGGGRGRGRQSEQGAGA
jgi:hypothetical protein